MKILTPPKKNGVKKKTAQKAVIGKAVANAAAAGAREGAAEVAASRFARQTGKSMAKSALAGSSFARQTGSGMLGGVKQNNAEAARKIKNKIYDATSNVERNVMTGAKDMRQIVRLGVDRSLGGAGANNFKSKMNRDAARRAKKRK